MKAYLRETGLAPALSPRYHLERGNTGYAMCSSRVRLDKSTGMPTRYVAGSQSCMKSGCLQGWDAADEVATFVTTPAALALMGGTEQTSEVSRQTDGGAE